MAELDERAKLVCELTLLVDPRLLEGSSGDVAEDDGVEAPFVSPRSVPLGEMIDVPVSTKVFLVSTGAALVIWPGAKSVGWRDELFPVAISWSCGFDGRGDVGPGPLLQGLSSPA